MSVVNSAVVRKWESPNPQVFGPNGAGSRVFALAETAFTLGIMLGPILSGSLLALVGYSNMNMILGESPRLRFSSLWVPCNLLMNLSYSDYMPHCFSGLVLLSQSQSSR